MVNRAIFTACVVALLFGAFFSASAYSTRADAASSDMGQVGVIVPLYTYPTDSSWSAVASAKESYPSVPIIAIINPDSGPGSSQDSNYVSGISNLESAGVTVIGYVATGYGTSSYSSVSNMESQINDYRTWYPNIEGIFFDEMSSSGSEAGYYQTLENYVSSLGMQVTVGNPGTTVDNGLVGIFNNLCIYENPGMPSVSDLNGYYSSYGNAGFSYIAYGISSLPSQSTMQSLDAYVSYIYVTNLGGSNPYDGLPSYFTSEVSALAAVDGASTSTTTHTSSTTTTTSSIATSTTSHSSSTTSSTSSSTTSTHTTTATTAITTSSSTSSNQYTIVIETVALSGRSITGVPIVVYNSAGQVVERGVSPLSFTATSGQTYTILATSHHGVVFNHWSTGSTSRLLSMDASGSATYVAYYSLNLYHRRF